MGGAVEVFSWGCPGLFKEQLEEEQEQADTSSKIVRKQLRKEGLQRSPRVVEKVAVCILPLQHSNGSG